MQKFSEFLLNDELISCGFLDFCVGSHHPKVGVVLTCIALMFRRKAMLEHSSSLLIQEVRTCILSYLLLFINFRISCFLAILCFYGLIRPPPPTIDRAFIEGR